MTEIYVSIISGVLSLAGVIITVLVSFRQTAKAFDVKQAVMEEKIAELTREVRMHNNFAVRVPVLEEQVKVANHRIEDLERGQNK